MRAGRDKWVTGYPDLHTGVDALSAIRGRDRLALDLVENPARGASRDAADDGTVEMGGGYRLRNRPAGRSRHNQLDDGLEQSAVSLHRPE